MFPSRYFTKSYWPDNYWHTAEGKLGDVFLVFCDSTLIPVFFTDATAQPVFVCETSETTLSFSAD
jgi:hypothetical protein